METFTFRRIVNGPKAFVLVNFLAVLKDLRGLLEKASVFFQDKVLLIHVLEAWIVDALVAVATTELTINAWLRVLQREDYKFDINSCGENDQKLTC